MNLVALKKDEQRRKMKGGWGKGGEREERGLVNGGETMREVEGRRASSSFKSQGS